VKYGNKIKALTPKMTDPALYSAHTIAHFGKI